jgi:hypothetical protein
LKKPTLAAQQIHAIVTQLMDRVQIRLGNMHTWLGMLGLQSAIDWARFDCLPDAGELDRITASGCSCKLNPKSLPVCTVHPCKCGCLKENDPLSCKWRTLHEEYIAGMQGISVQNQDGRLTYCQA